MFLDKAVKSILKCASKKNSGEPATFQAVNLADGRATVIHEGHYLMQVELPKDFTSDGFPVFPGENKPERANAVMLPAEDVDNALKNLPKKATLPILENALLTEGNSDHTVKLLSTDLEVHNTPEIRIMEGKYPEVERIIPQDAPKFVVGLNARYLLETCRAILEAGVGDKESPGLISLEIRGDDGKTPVVLRGKIDGEEREILAVIMPVRTKKSIEEENKEKVETLQAFRKQQREEVAA